MIVNFPEEILEYLIVYLYDSDCWCLTKSSNYLYNLMKQKLISNLTTKGRFKIDNVNTDKLSIKNENILVNEYIFYHHMTDIYFSKPVANEHKHLFISINKSNESLLFHNFEKAIVQDENGNTIRGIIKHETS